MGVVVDQQHGFWPQNDAQARRPSTSRRMKSSSIWSLDQYLSENPKESTQV